MSANRDVYRDSATGEFTTREDALARPSETERETVPGNQEVVYVVMDVHNDSFALWGIYDDPEDANTRKDEKSSSAFILGVVLNQPIENTW